MTPARPAPATLVAVLLSAAAAGAVLAQGVPKPRQESSSTMSDVRLMTVDPGHFHAALVQKEMYPGVDARVDVYAPLGPDLYEHLKRIDAFNRRPANPTAWTVDVHASADAFERMLRDRPGNVAVFSGRNGAKIERIAASVQAGLHVLADKPWILRSADLDRLEGTLAEADRTGVVAYDIMTERFEVTSILQRALVNDPAVFGEMLKGTVDDPAVYMESVHYLLKLVAGAPNIRPAWFFDNTQQGEGLNDVGTHLVDLVQWTLFPEQAIDYRRDVQVLAAQRWATPIEEAGFARVTGERGFPAAFAPSVKDGRFEYFCNTLVSYTLRGVHTTLNVIWDWEPAPGSGDTHYAFYKGSRATVEVRQTPADKLRPELYVIPASAAGRSEVLAAVRARVAALQKDFGGVTVEERANEIHVAIPDTFRVGHEAHFAEVTREFLRMLRDRKALPAWERPNMLAKYFVSTTGTELSHQRPPAVAPRRHNHR
jgi:predicted dehydrogenase